MDAGLELWLALLRHATDYDGTIHSLFPRIPEMLECDLNNLKKVHENHTVGDHGVVRFRCIVLASVRMFCPNRDVVFPFAIRHEHEDARQARGKLPLFARKGDR